MAQMNISIPEKLRGWAEQRVAEGRSSGVSERDPFDDLAELRAGLKGGSKDAAPS